MRESKFVFLTWFHRDGIKWKGCHMDFSYPASGFSKWQNPEASPLFNSSADAQLHLEGALNLKTWTITIFMRHIRNSDFRSWSVTLHMSGPTLLDAVRTADVKWAPISIALQKTSHLFTSNYSITRLIVPAAIQSLEESTQNLFLTWGGKCCLFVVPGIHI